ncbi:alginate O-acetyltransferase AlgX-related protein [Actinophytocola gossypii]|uniref:AlgX/AlgJ SGNH hydrolase-like domain-containing protein n=1 Tax=Actinophytocola gossypii TaxID=2812003 RepID=A0ABT2J2Y0_9PSEU|nr:hypothetical protein [Actinophytocola gossypii]MCT2581860.1 hypothetical protein [Actinophytocola gossypii]
MAEGPTGGNDVRGVLPPVHESLLPSAHPLYRPRHAGRQLLALVCAAVFFTAPVLAMALGARQAEFENRKLTEFPGLAQGWGFLTGLTPWAADNLPFRADALAAADWVSRELFGEPPAFDRAGPDVGVLPPAGPGEREDPEALAVPDVIEGDDGWLYLGDDIVSRCDQAQPVDETIARLRALRDGVERSGRRFVLIVGPDKTTVVPEYLPDHYVGQACAEEVADELWRRLTELDAVDLRDELRAWGERLGRPVYPRLDAHWSDEGGIVLTNRLAQAVEPGVSEGWKIDPVGSWETSADLPPLIGRSGLAQGHTYALRPDGRTDLTRDLPFEFASPVRMDTASGPGTVDTSVGYLGDSFTLRALRYLAAVFGDLTALHYGEVGRDAGRSAGRMLAEHEVVAVQIVERTLASGNSVLLDPEVVDGITAELAARPLR